MHLMTPEAQRILVEQRGQALRAAFGPTRRIPLTPVRLGFRRRARRVAGRAATA